MSKIITFLIRNFINITIHYLNIYMLILYNNYKMARGNQREIDRERARKRNAEKGSDNKRDQKSDFIANK